jgi:hypothetical protein
MLFTACALGVVTAKSLSPRVSWMLSVGTHEGNLITAQQVPPMVNLFAKV